MKLELIIDRGVGTGAASLAKAAPIISFWDFEPTEYGLFGPNFPNIFPGEDPQTLHSFMAAPMSNTFRHS